MASIGTLTADLILRTAAFIRDLKNAGNLLNSEAVKMRQSLRQIEKAAGGVEKSIERLRVGAEALAAAFAVEKFREFAEQAIDSADKLAKTANAVGLTTTALQQYRAAAALSGVDSEKLDAGLSHFVKTLGDAKQNTGKFVEAFKDTDRAFLTNVQNARTVDQALGLVFAKIAAVKDPTEKARIATAAFGKEQAKLVNVVADGVAGLEDMKKKALELGLVMDASLIKKAEEINDSMDLLKTAFKTGFNSEIIRAFAESFHATTDNILAAKEAGEKFGQGVGVALKAVIAVAGVVVENMRAIAAAIAGIVALQAATMFAGVAVAVIKFSQALLAAAKAGQLVNIILSRNVIGVLAKIAIVVAAAAGAWDLLDKSTSAAIGNVDEEVQQLAEGFNDPALDKATKKLALQAVQYDQLSAAIGRNRLEYLALKDAIELENDLTEKNVSVTTKQGRAYRDAYEAQQAAKHALNRSEGIADLEEEISNNEKLIAALKVGTKEYERQAKIIEVMAKFKADLNGAGPDEIARIEGISRALGDQAAEIDTLKKHNEDLRQAENDFANAIGTAFEDAVIKGNSLRDVMKGLLQDIDRIVLRVVVTKPLETALTKALGGDKSGGGGWLDSLLSGRIFGGGLPNNGVSNSADAGTAMALAFHSGGIVGESPWAHARRFHTGGLASNEIPAVLLKDEEVLTRSDPRHAKNGGGSIRLGDINIYGNADDKMLARINYSQAQQGRLLQRLLSRGSRVS